MADTAGGRIPIRNLVLVPAVITLGITLLRLVGELMRWSETLFNRSAGGGFAIVGIVWLVPVFGVYFALKLAAMGHRPARLGRAIGLITLGLLILPVTVALGRVLQLAPGRGWILLFTVGSLIGLGVAYQGWPALGGTLVAYGLAARIPVAVIMLLAILGNWGTHYELGPPDFPAMAPLAKWVWIGLVPQMTLWMAFTVIVGGLVGSLAVAVMRRGSRNPTIA